MGMVPSLPPGSGEDINCRTTNYSAKSSNSTQLASLWVLFLDFTCTSVSLLEHSQKLVVSWYPYCIWRAASGQRHTPFACSSVKAQTSFKARDTWIPYFIAREQGGKKSGWPLD